MGKSGKDFDFIPQRGVLSTKDEGGGVSVAVEGETGVALAAMIERERGARA